MIPDFEYPETRRVQYVAEEHGTLLFLPVCTKCGRYVKADESVMVNGLGEIAKQPNATCAKCGRVEMPFEGYL